MFFPARFCLGRAAFVPIAWRGAALQVGSPTVRQQAASRGASPSVATAHSAKVRKDPVSTQPVVHLAIGCFRDRSTFCRLSEAYNMRAIVVGPETFSGAVCCRPIELPRCKAAPLQALCQSSRNGERRLGRKHFSLLTITNVLPAAKHPSQPPEQKSH